ncbi:MAG: DUF4402 domain-containing protein [Bacteroidales bacterium]|nr:DUF4402 domain-containing protein [Bacteroidales bacterium]
MKKSIFILASLIAMIFVNVELSAQTATASATANSSARIVSPLELIKEVDLAFGNIAAGPSAGTVTIATDGSRTGNGGITLIAAGNSNSAATFVVVGYPNATFTIDIPVSTTIEYNGNQMVVDNYVSDLGASSVLDGIGEATLNVGATLNVASNQQSGLYTGTFDVIVAYN